jgi:hypothetical protein
MNLVLRQCGILLRTQLYILVLDLYSICSAALARARGSMHQLNRKNYPSSSKMRRALLLLICCYYVEKASTASSAVAVVNGGKDPASQTPSGGPKMGTKILLTTEGRSGSTFGKTTRQPSLAAQIYPAVFCISEIRCPSFIWFFAEH